MDLKLRGFQAPRAGALFQNHTSLILDQAKVEVQIQKGGRVVAARQFSTTEFNDHDLGRHGRLLPHAQGYFTLQNTFSPEECAGTDGYWLKIISAKVHSPAPAERASFEDLCALILNRDEAAVSRRLEREPALARLREREGTTLMHAAAFASMVPLMQQLKAAGGSYTARALFGVEPAHSAASINAYPSIFLLAGAGADMDCKDEDGARPLHYAAQWSRLDCIHALAGKVDVNAVNDLGQTPLDLCSLMGQEEAAQLLLHMGANPNIRDAEGKVPLHHFSVGGSAKILKALVKAGTPVDVSYTEFPFTALLTAAKNGNGEGVRALLELGADPNFKTQNGNTPGDLATKYGFGELGKFLKSKER